MTERPYVEHDPGCEGGHVASVSCAEVARWRAAALRNPAYCQYGRNGYHSFDGDSDDARCVYGECARTLGEALGKQRPYVSFDPAVYSGRPTVSGAPVETIAGAIWRGDTIDDTAEDYGITRWHVLTACWWIGAFGPWRWRRRWGTWAKAAHEQLWHGRYETIPDPPRRPR